MTSLESTLDEARAGEGIPGCSLAVVNRTGLRWSTALGRADLRWGRLADPGTVYHLFSGTKLFTAVAVLQLEERGLLALDDPVARFLPELPGLEGVTLLHLLSHRSGLRDDLGAFLAVAFPGDGLPTTAQALARYRIRREGPPGREVAYRNVNFALLGEVVTRASGVPYAEYVRANVLEPLGSRASFTLTEAMRGRAATGYVGRFDPMRLVLWLLEANTRGRLYGERVGGLVELKEYNLATSAIGGLMGTVEDFAPFLHSQLTGGGPVLSSASTRRMQTLIAEGAAGIASRFGVGLGWKLGKVGGRLFLNHEGGGAGFTSELRLYPDAGLGIVLMMNAMRMPRTMRLAHRLCELVYERRDLWEASRAR